MSKIDQWSENAMMGDYDDPTLIHMFKNRLDAIGSKTAVKQIREKRILKLSWRELGAMVENLGMAWENLGISRGDVVAILGETRMEWMMSDFANMALGAITVGLYTTSTTEQMKYILDHSEAKMLVVDDTARLRSLKPVLSECPAVRNVIVMNPRSDDEPEIPCLYMEDMFRETHEAKQREEFWDRTLKRNADPDAPISYIYTSGTTGPPKGAVLSHKNFLIATKGYLDAVELTSDDSLLSVLPLAHALQRMLDYTTLRGDGTLCYAQSLKTMVEDVKLLRPSFVGGVPRLMEKIYEAVRTKAYTGGAVKRSIFDWSAKVAAQYAETVNAKKPVTGKLAFQHRLATKLVLGKVKAALGDNVRCVGSGGAALAPDIAKFFIGCGIPVMEAWGLTETAAYGTINHMDDYTFGAAGKPTPGCEIKLADDGEILFRGESLFAGYYKTPPDQMAEVIENGWFKTGDVGRMDDNGVLFITDRKKELIITAYGKNISPQNIENELKLSGLIENAFVYGDNQKYLIALIVPDRDRVINMLTNDSALYDANIPLHSNVQAKELISREINAANKRLASYENIRKFAMVSEPFTIETGEITPTMKLKRRNIVSKYKGLIRTLYDVDWVEMR